jgi:hypothetical protein
MVKILGQWISDYFEGYGIIHYLRILSCESNGFAFIIISFIMVHILLGINRGLIKTQR